MWVCICEYVVCMCTCCVLCVYMFVCVCGKLMAMCELFGA